MKEVIPQTTDNLSTLIVLPLIKYNKHSFGDTFIQCLVTEDYEYIIVKLTNDNLIDKTHAHYETKFTQDDNIYVVFNIPTEFNTDIKLITEGKYTKISDKAKAYIKEYSGMSSFYLDENKQLQLNNIYLAINDSMLLRKKLEYEIDTDLTGLELFSKPNLDNELFRL